MNGDGVLDIFAQRSGTADFVVFQQNTESFGQFPEINLLTEADARSALEQMKEVRDAISSRRSDFGATESRVQVAIQALSARKLGAEDAASRITDADIATESSELIRLNILQQAAAAVLAQANQQPALALQLLS